MSDSATFTIRAWTVNPALNLLANGERTMRIEPRAMDLLVRLAEGPGEVVSIDDLFSSVWRGVVVSENSVYVAIKQLRQALDVPGEPSCIETIPKRGYRLTASVLRPARASPAAPSNGAASSSPDTAPVGRQSPAPWLVSAGLAVALCAALVPAASVFLRATVPPARAHWQVAAQNYVPNGGLTIAPDGKHITFVAATDGVRRIWLRPVDSPEAHALPGTENASFVFWSPDSRSIAFTRTDLSLLKIDIRGGPAEILGDESRVAAGDGAWGDDGTLWITTQVAGTFPIATVELPSGDLSPVTAPDFAAGETAHVLPRVLPDGDHFLYVGAGPDLDVAGIYVGSRTERATKIRLLSIASVARWGRTWSLAYVDGFLLYVDDTTLFAHRFDAETLTLRGDAFAVRENVEEFAVSDTGVLIYTERAAQSGGYASTLRRLAWFSRSGERLGQIDVPPAEYSAPALSPDGTRVAVSVIPSPKPSFLDVSIIDAESGGSTLLTLDEASDEAPIWSPSGSQVVFSSARGGTKFLPNALYRRAADGTGPDELLLSGAEGEVVLPSDWSRDGGDIVFGRSNSVGKDVDIWVLPASRAQEPLPLLASRFRERNAVLSPDGRFIAYVSDETGRDEIFVRPYPDVDRGLWLVSSGGGVNPRWRRDGRELFYMDPDGVLMALDVQTGADVLAYQEAHALFPTGINVVRTTGNYYDVAPDGQRFLLVEAMSSGNDPASASAAVIPIHVIVNWASGLDSE